MPLQIRRGLSSQMTSSVTPETGEPIFTTDTDKLYIGDGTTTADVLVPVNPDMNTTDLDDVSSSAPANGQFLLYDSASTSYIPTNATINNLTNVDITSVANGETLVYNSITSAWENGAGGGGGGTLSGLSDVTITSVANGETLVYNSITSAWENGAGGGGGGTLSGLSDVTITSVANGETLVYNSITSAWENGAGGGGGSSTLSGLSDVTITSVADGDVIRYDAVTGTYINDPYARGLSTLISAYMAGGAQIEAVSTDVALSFTNGSGFYAGIEDNSFSTGTIGQCLTADGNGGLNWEQVLLENAAGGTLYDAVDDTAAASGGVPVGGIYRDGSTLKVRVS
jgi:hypothetical protein